jgi:hypothetical protein
MSCVSLITNLSINATPPYSNTRSSTLRRYAT